MEKEHRALYPAAQRRQHTPGPWRYQEESDAYTHIVRAGDRFLCQLAQDTTGEAEANARLMAASPDLAEPWEPSDDLGLFWHLELACRVLEGSLPAESVDIEGVTGYIRRRAGMARVALHRAGLLTEEG